jgi:hypothetical protein
MEREMGYELQIRAGALISVNSIAKWILSTAIARMPGAPIFKFALPKMRACTMNEYTTLWSEALKSERRNIKMNEDFCDAMNAAIAAGLERAPTKRHRQSSSDGLSEPTLASCFLFPKVALQKHKIC